jgi:hypothetical protein
MLRSYGDWHLGRACALAGLEHFAEAQEAVAQGEALFISDQGRAHARTELALIFGQMHALEKAEAAYREAVALMSGAGKDAIYERYRLALILLARDEAAAVPGVLSSRAALDYPFREPSILLYVLGLLQPDQVQEVLSKSIIASRGDGDFLADYFAGRIDAAGLLARPDDYNDVDQQDRLCVIHFFLGEWMLPKNRAEAIAHFQAAVATGSRYLPEYMAAHAILQRLTAQ